MKWRYKSPISNVGGSPFALTTVPSNAPVTMFVARM